MSRRDVRIARLEKRLREYDEGRNTGDDLRRIAADSLNLLVEIDGVKQQYLAEAIQLRDPTMIEHRVEFVSDCEAAIEWADEFIQIDGRFRPLELASAVGITTKRARQIARYLVRQGFARDCGGGWYARRWIDRGSMWGDSSG